MSYKHTSEYISPAGGWWPNTSLYRKDRTGRLPWVWNSRRLLRFRHQNYFRFRKRSWFRMSTPPRHTRCNVATLRYLKWVSGDFRFHTGHEQQPAGRKSCVCFDPSTHNSFFHMQTFLLLMLRPLTVSSVPVITTTTTRGHHLAINVNTDRNNLLAKTTYMAVFLVRTDSDDHDSPDFPGSQEWWL